MYPMSLRAKVETTRGNPQGPQTEEEMVIVPNMTLARPATRAGTAHAHECQQGFCVVCGSVWPCYRAQRTSLPRPRLRATP